VLIIIRRSKLYYASSGIITPVGGRPVHGTATYRCDDNAAVRVAESATRSVVYAASENLYRNFGWR